MFSSTNENPTFLIDSSDRISGTSSNFSINLNLKHNNNYDTVSVSSLSIPKTYHTIPNFKNYFFLREDGHDDFLITYEPGNYDITNFLTVTENLLNQYSPSGFNYSCSFPNYNEVQTNKITITVSNNGSIQPSIIIDGDSMHQIFGFYEDSTNTFVSNELISSTYVNFQFTKYLTLRSDLASNVGNGHFDSAILARISCGNVNDGDIIKYESNHLLESMKNINNNKSSIYNFSLTDDHDREINLNNHEWKMQLFMFKYNEFYDLSIKDFKKNIINNPIPPIISSTPP